MRKIEENRKKNGLMAYQPILVVAVPQTSAKSGDFI